MAKTPSTKKKNPRRAAVKKSSAAAGLARPKKAQAASGPDKTFFDRMAIREVVENWVLYRDAGDWERFKSVWHEDGYMMATWFQGTAEEFAKVSKDGFEKGVSIMHFLGGTTMDLAGNRAIVQTKMTISQRAPVEGVVCDVLCTGRFFDFFEKRRSKWAIVLRRLFYEKDRMDPLDPSARLKLDPKVLESFPVGYRHLAYLQSKLGYPVKRDMPGTKGPEADALYAHGRDWLAGKPIDTAKK